MNKYVSYTRVSREDQGKSGLGLKAQKRANLSYISENGELVGQFQDVESGASETRQGMIDAINCCRVHGAILVVKELSRITRGGFEFRQMLQKYGIPYIESVSPHDPEVVKGIKFELAEEERRKVVKRTTDALTEIKETIEKDGVYVSKAGNVITSLGSPKNLTDFSRQRSIEVRRRKARTNPDNVKAGAFIVALAGTHNFKQITIKLNEAGFKTSRGNDFSEVQTKRLYNRYKTPENV